MILFAAAALAASPCPVDRTPAELSTALDGADARIDGDAVDGRFGAALAASDEGVLIAAPGGPGSVAAYAGAAWWLSIPP